MPIGWILLAIGIAGFGLAGYWDLKTTEFPDWLPYSMIILALAVRSGFSLLTGDLAILTTSIMVGVAFLALGLLLFYLKQWGDGDAWLLGAFGFLFPTPTGFVESTLFPFPIMVLFNFFLVAFIYLVAYALVLGFRARNIRTHFMESLRRGSKQLAAIIIAFTAATTVLAYYMSGIQGIPLERLYYLALFPVFLAFILVFMRYGRVIENKLFRKKIPASRLRIGDVLVSDRWRGLSKKEVSALKKKGGYVWIKEGVRFSPVFLIALIITLFYGNLFLLFF